MVLAGVGWGRSSLQEETALKKLKRLSEPTQPGFHAQRSSIRLEDNGCTVGCAIPVGEAWHG